MSEAEKSLRRGFKAGGLVYGAMIALEVVLADFDKWYLGPYAKEFAGLLSMFVMYRKTKRATERYANTGPEPRGDE